MSDYQSEIRVPFGIKRRHPSIFILLTPILQSWFIFILFLFQLALEIDMANKDQINDGVDREVLEKLDGMLGDMGLLPVGRRYRQANKQGEPVAAQEGIGNTKKGDSKKIKEVFEAMQMKMAEENGNRAVFLAARINPRMSEIIKDLAGELKRREAYIDNPGAIKIDAPIEVLLCENCGTVSLEDLRHYSSEYGFLLRMAKNADVSLQVGTHGGNSYIQVDMSRPFVESDYPPPKETPEELDHIEANRAAYNKILLALKDPKGQHRKRPFSHGPRSPGGK